MDGGSIGHQCDRRPTGRGDLGHLRVDRDDRRPSLAQAWSSRLRGFESHPVFRRRRGLSGADRAGRPGDPRRGEGRERRATAGRPGPSAARTRRPPRLCRRDPPARRSAGSGHDRGRSSCTGFRRDRLAKPGRADSSPWTRASTFGARNSRNRPGNSSRTCRPGRETPRRSTGPSGLTPGPDRSTRASPRPPAGAGRNGGGAEG
jgi:hypothetical protein